AFTSWDDSLGGHLWKVRGSGGAPERLTRQPAEYTHPAWSPDGSEIVLARGSGETRHGRGLVWDEYWDLVRIPSAGGAVAVVVRLLLSPDGTTGSAFNNIRNQIVRPSWGPDGRIFYPHLAMVGGGNLETTFYSVRPDGSDRRAHATFPFADEVVTSPDGTSIA